MPCCNSLFSVSEALASTIVFIFSKLRKISIAAIVVVFIEPVAQRRNSRWISLISFLAKVTSSLVYHTMQLWHIFGLIIDSYIQRRALYDNTIYVYTNYCLNWLAPIVLYLKAS